MRSLPVIQAPAYQQSMHRRDDAPLVPPTFPVPRLGWSAEKPLITSVSELTSWMRCRLQHYWRYQARLEPETPSQNLAMGTLGHAVMEEFYKVPRLQRGPKRMTKLCKRMIMAHKPCQEAMTVTFENRQLIQAMLIGYSAWVRSPSNDYTDKAIGLDTCIPEMEFDLPMTKLGGKLRLRGKMDAVFLSTNERKTVGILESKFQKDLDLSDMDTRLQITLYLWALRQLYPGMKRYVVYFQPLRKQMPTPRVRTPLFVREPVERTAEELDQFEVDMWAACADMMHTKVYPTKQKDCKYMCDFKGPCDLRGNDKQLLFTLKNNYVQRAGSQEQAKRAKEHAQRDAKVTATGKKTSPPDEPVRRRHEPKRVVSPSSRRRVARVSGR